MTTYEVELKVRADHEPVRRRLADRNATYLGRVEQTDTYYDAPDRNFAETDEALRIRRERSLSSADTAETNATSDAETHATSDAETNATSDAETSATSGPASGHGTTSDETDPTARLTYKGPLIDTESKTREEAETTVGDGETADSILRGLGYEPAATVSKRRDRFALDGYTVTLDTIAELDTFVEIDREVTGDPEPAREKAKRLLRELGLDPDDSVQTSYLGLLLADE